MVECSFQKSKEAEQQLIPKSGDQPVIVDKEMDIWSVYVDGSSVQEGVGARILLIDQTMRNLSIPLSSHSPLLTMQRNMKPY